MCEALALHLTSFVKSVQELCREVEQVWLVGAKGKEKRHFVAFHSHNIARLTMDKKMIKIVAAEVVGLYFSVLEIYKKILQKLL